MLREIAYGILRRLSHALISCSVPSNKKAIKNQVEILRLQRILLINCKTGIMLYFNEALIMAQSIFIRVQNLRIIFETT